MKRIAIFASGSGSNAINFIQHFHQHTTIEISVIYCNNPNAGIIERAFKLSIPVVVFSRDKLNGGWVLRQLQLLEINYVVLAGFLWLIPNSLIDAFQNRIVNIHPALLPKYGGKGMYGHHVHEAVVAAGEEETGITIHLVDSKYDNGKHLFQTTTKLTSLDTPETVATKIHLLEQAHYPRVVEEWVEQW